jgi:hypothetical protein
MQSIQNSSETGRNIEKLNGKIKIRCRFGIILRVKSSDVGSIPAIPVVNGM